VPRRRTLPLLLLPGDTHGFFAFDISLPLSARFLGGCYLAGFAALAVAWRERAWGGAAVIGPGVFAASALTLAVTFMNPDRFHFAAAGTVGMTLAWGWLGIGILGPAGWLYLVFSNDRGWVADPGERPSLPRPLLLLVLIQSLVLLAVGSWLFVAPDSAPWPWRLGSPTDRLAGGWLVAGALTGLAVVAERDEGRSRPAFAACLVFAVIQPVVLLLSPGQFGFNRVTGGYGLLLACLLISASGGLRRGILDRRPRAAPLVR
jgi:hypothetical protein